MRTEEATQRTIGKYEVLGTLGRGSMGVVYKAKDPEIGRTVAIKTLRRIQTAHFHDADMALERFRNEARSAGNLRHPNIITIFEINRDQDTPYLVMDYVEGEGLETVIQAHAPLGPTLVVQYMVQVAAALDYAHARGVVHRDIKPGNILVDKSGNVFVLDYGVATINESFSESKASTTAGPVMGTPGYMSPEQILNQPLDHRSDLFSFASVTFECFTSKRPFPGETFTVVVGNILNNKPLSLTEMVPSLPLALEEVFEKALSKDKEQRFDNAMSFIEAVTKAVGLDESPSKAALQATHLPSAPRKRKSSSWKSFKVKKEDKETNGDGGRQRINTSERLSPWRPDTIEPDLSSIASNPHATSRRNPGAQWAHEDVSLNPSRNLFVSRNSSMRHMTLILSGVSISLGFFLLWMLFGPTRTNSNSTVHIASSSERPDTLEAAEVPAPKPKIEPVVEGKDAQEMTDGELLSLIMNEKAPEVAVVKALQVARERKLYALVESAAPALRSDSYIVRIETVKALGQIGDKRAVPELVIALDDHDPFVRSHVAEALGMLGDRRALGYLSARFLKEEASNVKQEIKKAIEKINGFPMKR